MNSIESCGALAISSRLQRLSEQIRKDGAQLYKSFGFDFEPKWFPVIYTLSQKPLLSVVEIANEIGYSHPSTISLLKELEKQKLLVSQKDKADERKRLLKLTKKGEQLVFQMQPVWEIMKTALEAIINNNDHLLKAIDQAEEALNKQSFLQRAAALKNQLDDI